MISTQYSDAFENEVVSETWDHESDAGDDVPESWDDGAFEDDGYEMYDSDYEPDFYDDDDCEIVAPAKEDDKVIDHKLRLEELNEQYKDALEECNGVLKGKLNWVGFSQPTPAAPNFAPLHPEPATGFSKFSDFKKSSIPVKIGIPSKITFRAPKQPRAPCKFILNGQTCSRGAACLFDHSVKPVVRVMRKNRFCKNMISEGRCRFENRCSFAHSFEEISKNVEPCRYETRCNLVKRAKNGDYSNRSDKKTCMRIHPRETPEKYVTRTQ